VREAPAGPIALFAAAAIVNQFRRDAGIRLAKTGLDRISLAGYRGDYMAILSNDALQPHINSLGAAIRALDTAEISALTRWIPPEWGQKHLRRCLVQLANEKEKPVVEVLPPILDEMWEVALKERLADAFRSLAGRAPGKTGESRE
jgi:hypothetical protein